MMLCTIPGQRSCSFSLLPLFLDVLELRYTNQVLTKPPVRLQVWCSPAAEIILPKNMTQSNKNLHVISLQ